MEGPYDSSQSWDIALRPKVGLELLHLNTEYVFDLLEDDLHVVFQSGVKIRLCILPIIEIAYAVDALLS